MFKVNHNKAQAAAELAVFGAILIFLLGAIVRSAVGNSYTQNQNFKAMRMALLASWNGSKSAQGLGAVANLARNSASILFVEDRLSPDFNKYGDLDRNPFIANGSGSFTYEMLYPVDPDEAASQLPIMDVYINGQHFPFTTANYFTKQITPDTSCSGAASQSTSNVQTTCLQGCTQPPTDPAYQQCVLNCQQVADQQCGVNQCLRDNREWVGGTVVESQFQTVIPLAPGTALDAGTDATMANNASAIFTELTNEGIISIVSGAGLATQAHVNSALITPLMPIAFVNWLEATFPTTAGQEQADEIQAILLSNKVKYKLFYSLVANALGKTDTSGNGASTQFSTSAPDCPSHPCKDKELSSDQQIGTLKGADLMFDLQRSDDSTQTVPANMRPYVSWEWSATAATSDKLIGLDVSNNQYPSYDINGSLKEVTIYSITYDATTGYPTVGYEDYQGGDIDAGWDTNSCGPKPGLQSNSEIFTFTKDGTYLQIKEGKLYNPETGQEVRSASVHNSIDLIQRTIQLSNNTGRFCTSGVSTPPKYVQKCAGYACTGDSTDLNPVEICVDGNGNNNCSNGANLAMTCYDTTRNIIYVRSRLEDRRGNFWMTNASGQLKVQ